LGCLHRHHRHRALWEHHPERKFPSVFEPVHGSAPDIYGKNIANPSGNLVGRDDARHLGHKDAGAAIVRAIERVLTEGARTATSAARIRPRTSAKPSPARCNLPTENPPHK